MIPCHVFVLYDDKLCTHVNKRYSLFCSDNVFGRNQTKQSHFIV